MSSTRARVTVIAPCLSRGGMTRAYFVSRVLQHIGHQVDLIGHLPGGETIYPDPPAGLDVAPVHGRFPTVIRSIARCINGDVAYAVKPLPTSFGAALVRKRDRGIPVIVDVDDHELLFRSQKIQRRSDSGPLRTMTRASMRFVRHLPRRLTSQHSRLYLRWMERRLSHADAITTNTRTLQGIFGGILLPSGKDTDLFDPSRFDDDDCRRALGLEGRFVVMFPGTAREHKGLEDVLEALEQLGNANARLVIVGGREIGVEYSRELARRWPQWVHVLPPRGIDEMPATVAAAHVVVVAQRDVTIARAQFPIKLTDAMAMARPIITTSVGDIPEIVADTAWVVPPSSPADIASALRDIASDADRARQRGDAARQRCIETLSLDSAAEVLKRVMAAISHG